MPTFLLIPVITLLALVLAWRTRGWVRGVSLVVAILSLVFFIWFFSALLAALESA